MKVLLFVRVKKCYFIHVKGLNWCKIQGETNRRQTNVFKNTFREKTMRTIRLSGHFLRFAQLWRHHFWKCGRNWESRPVPSTNLCSLLEVVDLFTLVVVAEPSARRSYIAIWNGFQKLTCFRGDKHWVTWKERGQVKKRSEISANFYRSAHNWSPKLDTVV